MPKLLQSGIYMAMEKTELLEKLRANKRCLGRYYYLFILQYMSGCRISEALNVHADDCSEQGKILIRGLKGSKDRIVNCEELIPLILRAKELGWILFYGMNRFTAYRLLKGLGIQRLKKGRKRESVTHIFRDEHSKECRRIGATGDSLKDSLGHKTQKNTDFYGKD